MNLRKETLTLLTAHFKGDLDFDLQPHPRAWTLRSELMETKQTL